MRVAQVRRRVVANWIRSSTASLRAALTLDALTLAEQLLIEVLELDQAGQLSELRLSASVRYSCLERERLQAVLTVLEPGQSPTVAEKTVTETQPALTSPSEAGIRRLRQAVEHLDSEAEHHFSQLASARVDHPLLMAVAALQPDRWWGRTP